MSKNYTDQTDSGTYFTTGDFLLIAIILFMLLTIISGALIRGFLLITGLTVLGIRIKPKWTKFKKRALVLPKAITT